MVLPFYFIKQNVPLLSPERVIMSVYAFRDSKTNEMALSVEYDISPQILKFEKDVATGLFDIIQTKIYVEFEALSDNNDVSLIVFKDNDDVLSQHQVSTHVGIGSTVTLFGTKHVNKVIAELYSQYVHENIDLKIDMMGL